MALPGHLGGPSLARRATLAVLLFIGFYALGLGLAGGLAWIPYWMWKTDHMQWRVAFFAAVGAGIILWSLIPRFDRFEPPGPVLSPEWQPELFATIRAVADETRQEMPAEVHAIGELNAWVSQRGGVMGFGSRRVMGIGLPLMQSLTVTEFRGVVAHEFGHYHGGDTMLLPWIHRTRMGIGRTIENLANHSGVLMKPFEWYGNAFLRVTHGVSRQQEYVADAVAARVVGTGAMISGLQAVQARSGAFHGYWFSEFVPALETGHRPPLTRGFSHFLSVPRVATMMAGDLEKAMAATDPVDPYDTHPPLAERVNALHLLEDRPVELDARSAIELMRDLPRIEAELMAFISQPEKPYTEVSWEELPERAMVPSWRSTRATHAAYVAGLRIGDLAQYLGRREALFERLHVEPPPGMTLREAYERSGPLVGILIAAALTDAGFTPHSMPGEPIVLRRGGVECRPFEMANALFAEGASIEQWLARADVAPVRSVLLSPGPERELVRPAGPA